MNITKITSGAIFAVLVSATVFAVQTHVFAQWIEPTCSGPSCGKEILRSDLAEQEKRGDFHLLGNLGIKTENPGDAFEIFGGGNVSLESMSIPGALKFYNSVSDEFGKIAVTDNGLFLAADTQRSADIFLQKNGSVGIGSNKPQSTLHVAGSMKVVDGTQGANKVFVSDAAGKGGWKNLRAVYYCGYYSGGLCGGGTQCSGQYALWPISCAYQECAGAGGGDKKGPSFGTPGNWLNYDCPQIGNIVEP